MGHASHEAMMRPIVARVWHGRCRICGEAILIGQTYVAGVLGSRTVPVCKTHWDCYHAPAARHCQADRA